MKNEQEIRDELQVCQQNLKNLGNPENEKKWIALYKRLSPEDRGVLLIHDNVVGLLPERIAAFEWVLSKHQETNLKEYLETSEIPYEIKIKLEMYQGMNIHDVKQNTSLLKAAYRDKDQDRIKKYTDILRGMVAGI